MIKTLSNLQTNCFSNRRRKCVANHPTCRRFLFPETPMSRETLHHCYHFFGQLRHANEIPARRLVCDTKTINTQLTPRATCPRRPQIRTAVFFAASDYSRRDSIGLCNPCLKPCPTVGTHQISQGNSNRWCRFSIWQRIVEFALLVIANAHDYNSWPNLRDSVVIGLKKLDRCSITKIAYRLED